MAVVVTDGFDMYNGTGTNIGLGTRWAPSYQVTNGTFSTTPGRFGGQAMRLTGGGFNSLITGNIIPGSPTSFAFGMAIRMSVVDANLANFGIQFTNSLGGFQGGVGFTATGAALAFSGQMQNGQTTIASGNTPGLISPNNWFYLEAEIVLSVSGSINMYINGQQVLMASGINTLGAGSGGASAILMAMYGSGIFDFDDLYITNTAVRLGESRIETLRPVSNNTTQWVPYSGSNFANVNNAVVNGVTSVSASAVGNLDLYNMASLSVSNPNAITSVNIVSFAQKTDATTRAIYNVMVSNGIQAVGNAIFLSNGITRYDNIQPIDPNTSSVWTVAAVNALLVGPELAV